MHRTYLDVHILQTVPPSNLNRDETGTPKWATYGGVRRARVSSQAWKRATRVRFAEVLPRSDLAVRTRELVDVITGRLTTASVPAALAADAAMAVVASLGLTTKKTKRQDGRDAHDTEYALFLGHQHIDEITDAVAAHLTRGRPDVKRAVAAADPNAVVAGAQPVDIALFGRMVADVSHLNVDAACQVAHALSTHGVDTEFDYFTTVDEEKASRGDKGAAMIGTVEFNSAVLYRYATVDLPHLASNLGGDWERAVAAATAFADAFVRSMPSGKQNTFANRTLPEVVVLAVRDDQPLNLVGAFEDPVVSDSGFLRESFKRLADHASVVHRLYDATPVLTVATYDPSLGQRLGVADTVGRATPLAQALNAVRARLVAPADAPVPAPAGAGTGEPA
jgi:CRISPR system Cascade subunit CasC